MGQPSSFLSEKVCRCHASQILLLFVFPALLAHVIVSSFVVFSTSCLDYLSVVSKPLGALFGIIFLIFNVCFLDSYLFVLIPSIVLNDNRSVAELVAQNRMFVVTAVVWNYAIKFLLTLLVGTLIGDANITMASVGVLLLPMDMM